MERELIISEIEGNLDYMREQLERLKECGDGTHIYKRRFKEMKTESLGTKKELDQYCLEKYGHDFNTQWQKERRL